MPLTNCAADRSLIMWGVAALALPGHAQSGDRYVVQPFQNGALVAVVDGIGHGDEAAVAAKTAVATLEASAHERVTRLIERCHEALIGTRGAAISLAAFNTTYQTLTWLGVGSVEGVLFRADSGIHPPYESLLLRGGTPGDRIPPLHASVFPVMPGDTLILFTNGIGRGFTRRLPLGGSPQRTADRILAEHSKGTDDALVLVVRYLGEAGRGLRA